MSYQKIKKLINKGYKQKCAVSGLYFHLSEMVKDSSGRWVYKKFIRKDHEASKYKKGKKWERTNL